MKKLRKISRDYYLKHIVTYLLVNCMVFVFPARVALGEVVLDGVQAGNITVTPLGNGATQDMTASHGSIGRFSDFDILTGNAVTCLQPGNSAWALFKVGSVDGTQIYGTFSANGNICLQDSLGILVGPTGVVNANQFIASTLNVLKEDFQNYTTGVIDELKFQNLDGSTGAVINEGVINAVKAYLVGTKVVNSGTISAKDLVVMAAGDRVLIGRKGSDVLVEVGAVKIPADLSAEGLGDVINEGTIEAAGGKIVLAAGDTFSRAIEGLDALALSAEGGTGRVGQFGTITADAVEGDGGSITLTAGEVVALGSDSVTTANAGANGDGGEVIVYSPDTALFHAGAQIEAKGGSESGNGGFVEVSGKKHVEIFGLVDTTAPQGNTGTFLIDPFDIEIVSGVTQNGGWTGTIPDYWISNVSADSQLAVADLLANLDNTNVIIMTAQDFLNPDSDITVSTAIDYTDSGGATYNNLTLAATDDVLINQPITTGTHNLTLAADIDHSGFGNVDVGAGITLSGGDFTSSGIDFDNTGGVISSGGGAIGINHTGTVTLGADLDSGGGSMSGTSTSIGVASSLAEIQDAINVAASGATVTVDDGTYTEDLTINKSDLTLKSVNGRDDTTIQLVDGVGINIGSGGVGLTLGGGSSDGFKILGGAATTFNIQLENAPSDVEISWNDIDTTGNASQGISIGAAGATDLKINNNTFTAEEGDISIWGPEMVGLTVSENEFTGPGGPPASGWAIQFAGVTPGGVTGSSTITDNTITGYGGGIAISNGEATSDLTISNNNISASKTGIRLGQYTQLGHTPGDMTTVTVTANTLTGNTTGLLINDGANVKAGDFLITNNFFVNNTTGVESQHSSESATIYENSFTGSTDSAVKNTGALAMLNAVGNWWGDATGPYNATTNPSALGDAVSDKVDYSPWLGIGNDGSADPGFQMISPMTWWTNDFIQDAIDAANPGDAINVTAKTYIENVNFNKQLAGLYFMGAASSEIDGELTLTNDSDNWDGDVLGINTENQDLTLYTITDPATGEHSLTLNTGTATTYLNGPVTVGKDLTLMSSTQVAADKILDAGQDIVLNTDKSLMAAGALTVRADRNITLGGPVQAAGTMTLKADADTVDGESGSVYGGTMWAAKGLGTSAGDIDIYASDNTIRLDADVTAYQDLLLNNDTLAAPGIILDAGRYVDIRAGKVLSAEGSLTIQAGSLTSNPAEEGKIKAETSTIEMLAGGELTLRQNADLHMSTDFTVDNRANTDLVANSTAGAVTSSEADIWNSIEASAYTYISLDDSIGGGDITTNALTAETYIWVNSDNGKVYANGPINAGQDVKIAGYEGPDGEDDAIFLNYNAGTTIEAGRDIWLASNTWAAHGVEL
ncbi:MAG TPA: filamentous hemagglutinin N-terminal domain-containing protein, partial [Sedimentisphaerales bacterium]|nr:filamentous hemagglutinin N-terminal domain-containing protein [Sedimentisphaerales bacterium]